VTSNIETPDGTITVVQTGNNNSTWDNGEVKFVRADKTEVAATGTGAEKIFTVGERTYTITGSATAAPKVDVQ
jgi:flagellar basal body rod protein FlgF